MDFLAVDDLGFRNALDVDNGHAVADVLTRVVQHALAAERVERDRHCRRSGLLIGNRRRVDQFVAADDDLLLQHDRHRLAVGAEALGVVQARIRRHDTGLGRLDRIRVFVDRVVFERRLRAEDLLRLGRVLYAGQFHNDAVRALLLDQRLGYAKLVDAVAQRGQVAGNDRALLLL